jgi:hypothetical protein
LIMQINTSVVTLLTQSFSVRNCVRWQRFWFEYVGESGRWIAVA